MSALADAAGNDNDAFRKKGGLVKLGKCGVRHLSGVLLAAWAMADAAMAAEVILNAPGARNGLVKDLRNASLSLAAEDNARPQDLLAAARADYGRLLGALYGSGNYNGVISILVDGQEAADISPLTVLSGIDRIVITVQAGPAFRFSKAEVTPLAPGTELPDGFAERGRARSTFIQEAVDAGIDGWRAVGNAKATVAGQRIVANHATNRLSAEVKLTPGPRVTFGNLIIEGDSRVRRERIRAIAGFPTGEVFDPDALARTASRLRRSGAFRSVAMAEAEVLGPGDSMDITATVVDEKRRRLGFGAELSSLEGLGLSAYWMHRNLRGGAERLRFDAEVKGIGGDSGGIDYGLAVKYTRPATFGADTDLYLLGEIAREDEPEYKQTLVNLGGGVTRIFSDELQGEVGIVLRYSDVEDDFGKRQFHHLQIPVGATLDRRDDGLNPTEGYFVDLSVTPFIGIGGSASGGRVFGDARGYFGLGDDARTVLAGRVQIGSVVGADLDEVPPDMLFFSGGGGTVRGQPYQSLSVDLGGGLNAGGRSFLGLSGEVRFGITDSIGLVGFADAGYIGADSWIGSNSDWHAGAGLGLRYNTGIGPIRLDIAAPVSGNTGDGIQVYVGIGQSF